MTQYKKDIGAKLRVAGLLAPQTLDATTEANGADYDRTLLGMPGSAVLWAATGAATGGPSAQSHRFKLEMAPDDGTGSPGAYVDAVDDDGNLINFDITADNTLVELDVNLMPTLRHVRLTYDETNSTFTGGASPDNQLAGGIVFGGFEARPQN